jgi:hypothetical protein
VGAVVIGGVFRHVGDTVVVDQRGGEREDGGVGHFLVVEYAAIVLAEARMLEDVRLREFTRVEAIEVSERLPWFEVELVFREGTSFVGSGPNEVGNKGFLWGFRDQLGHAFLE